MRASLSSTLTKQEMTTLRRFFEGTTPRASEENCETAKEGKKNPPDMTRLLCTNEGVLEEAERSRHPIDEDDIEEVVPLGEFPEDICHQEEVLSAALIAHLETFNKKSSEAADDTDRETDLRPRTLAALEEVRKAGPLFDVGDVLASRDEVILRVAEANELDSRPRARIWHHKNGIHRPLVLICQCSKSTPREDVANQCDEDDKAGSTSVAEATVSAGDTLAMCMAPASNPDHGAYVRMSGQGSVRMRVDSASNRGKSVEVDAVVREEGSSSEFPASVTPNTQRKRKDAPVDVELSSAEAEQRRARKAHPMQYAGDADIVMPTSKTC